MTIHMNTKHFATIHSVPSPSDINDTKHFNEREIASFIDARNLSLGTPSTDSGSLAKQWHKQPRHASFVTMTQALLDEIKLPHTTQLELILFCHWSTDCEMGNSISNYIVENCDATEAFAFAISESGPVAPFLAFEIIFRWLLGYGHALMIMADQSSHMHLSTKLSDHQTDNVGAAILWSRNELDGLQSTYHYIDIPNSLDDGEWFESAQLACPFDLKLAHILTDNRSKKYWKSCSQITSFDDDAPCAWPFHLAKPLIAKFDCKQEPLSALVLCRTYRNTTHMLWFHAENRHENT